ncbi:WGxxGxxG family protein [Aeribacillus pallidus]|uniref:WGxxGxxG family protein n=1 Tax=Aeribacillus pallidus TaxID=33936 RepID=UPI001D1AD9CC|nr:WGxxGxxG-CTERM domain-containing protein [Bacillus sp. (in: firmicutes)]
MLKKFLYSFYALSLIVMLLGMDDVYAQNNNNDMNNQVADNADDDNDWGWIGLLGLAGLLGLRRRDDRRD